MCIFNYVNCSCCFDSLPIHRVTLCDNQPSTDKCKIYQQIFIDKDYTCFWCGIAFKCTSDNCKVPNNKNRKSLFKILNKFHSQPGNQQMHFLALKNFFLDPFVPESYYALCNLTEVACKYRIPFNYSCLGN